MAKSKKAIAESGHPVYLRHAYHAQYAVLLSAAIPLAIAAALGFAGGNIGVVVFAMISPILPFIAYVEYEKRWKANHPELVPPALKGIEARMEQLAAWQKSGQISQREYLKRMSDIQREATKPDALGR